MAIRVWDGGGADANWTTAANWVGDVAPTADDSLFLAAGAAQFSIVNDFADATRFRSITFTGSGYSVTGNSVALLEGMVASNAAGSNSFQAAIVLANSQTIVSANAAAQLDLGAVDTGSLLTLSVDGAGSTNVAGVISGSGGVTKQGSGMLILAGANSYDGVTAVNQGIVSVRNDSGLGASTAGTTVAAGAAIEIQGGVTVAEPLSITGTGIGLSYADGGALRSVLGNNVWSGGIGLAGNAVIGVDAGRLDISGVVASVQASGFAVTKVGPGTLRYSGSDVNTYTGSTTVLGGVLELNKTPGVNALSGALVIGDNIAANDSAVVRLLASHQIPDLDYLYSTINSVAINASGLLDLNGNSDTIGSLTLMTGPTASADVATGAGTLTLGGSLTVTSAQGSSGASPAATISGKLDLGSLFSGGAAAFTRTFSIGDTALTDIAADLEISAVISGSSSVALYRSGTGTLRLTGANTYSGPTLLTAGITEVGSNSAFGGGLVSVGAATLIAYGGSCSLANLISVDASFSVSGANDLTFAGAATMTASSTITVLNKNQTTTFAGGFGEGVFGARNLTKAGRGALAFTQAATYSGTTTLSADGGTILLKDAGSILNSSSFTIGQAAALKLDNSGTQNLADRLGDAFAITLSGGTLSFIGAAGTASTETVGVITLTGSLSSSIESTVGTGGSAILSSYGLTRTAANGASVNFVGTNGDLSATGSNQINFLTTPSALVNGILAFATVTGSGGLDFATYSGGSTGIAVYALPAAGYVTTLAAATSTSNVKLSSSETTSSKTVNALLLGTGVVVTGADATTTLTSSTGSLAFGGASAAINTAYLTLASDGPITVAAGVNATVGSIVTGASIVVKAGAGRLILAGANEFTGAMNVNQGVLNLRNSQALGSAAGATVVNAGAAIEIEDVSGAVNVGLEALTLTGSGVNDTGVLRNITGANNSWAGAITQAGVSLDATAFFANAGVVISGLVYAIDAGKLSLTGVISGNFEPIKIGAGTLEFAGIAANSYTGATRVKEGKLRLAKESGLAAIASSFVYVGDDDAIGAAGALEFGSSDQIADAAQIQLGSTGQLALNGNSEVVTGLVVTIGAAGASTTTLGSGILTNHGNITVQQIGAGHAAGATISGGTLNLIRYASLTGATRTFLINDGAASDDLSISSVIANGSEFAPMAVTKTGLGTLVYSGASANTYSGLTTINEGTLALAKNARVNAMTGALTIGDNNFASGGANSDIVVWRQSSQLPDFLALVTVQGTGLMDLAGFNETIGVANYVDALVLNTGNVATGAGTLTLGGNITSTASANFSVGAVVNSNVTPPTISGNLNLGSGSGAAPRTFTVGNLNPLAYDFIIDADISGGVGVDFIKAGAGNLLLNGDNAAMAGNVYHQAGQLSVGTDTALGTGFVSIGAVTIQAENGARQLANTIYWDGNVTVAGGDNLTLTGATTLSGGRTITITNALSMNLAGGIGEMYGAQALTKAGSGILVVSGDGVYSGVTTVSAGAIVLSGAGTLLNTASVTISSGASLILDNSAVSISNRLRDLAAITLNGGLLLFIGANGTATTEMVGAISLGGNTSSVIAAQNGSGGTSILTSTGALTRNAGAVVAFVGLRGKLGTAANRLFFTAYPTTTGGILQYAVLATPGAVTVKDRYDFVTYSTSDGITAAAFVESLAGASATSNVKLSASEAIAANTTVNAVLVVGNSAAITGANTLTVSSGSIFAAGSGNSIATAVSLGTAQGTFLALRDSLVTADSVAAITLSGVVSHTSGTAGLITAGDGRIVLSGTNTFTGATSVNRGVLKIQNASALGATAAGTTINAGAMLEIQGGLTGINEALSLNGTGVANRGSLRNIGGDNSWGTATTAITYATASTVSVDSAIGTLTFNATVTHTGNFTKIGSGTLVYGGTAVNAGAGTVTVSAGTLALDKNGFNAIVAALAIGDGVGGDNADVVKLLRANQILDTTTVTVNGSGLWNLNNNNETLAPTATTTVLTLAVGSNGSGDVATGTGTLTIGGTGAATIAVTNPVLGGTQVAAQIAGIVSITNSNATAPTFTVVDTAAIDDFVLAANVSGTGGLRKATANSRMSISGSNSYTGAVGVTAGEVRINSATALGASSGTTVTSGAALLLSGGITVTGASLNVSGTGTGTTGGVRNLDGNNTWAGSITMAAATTFGVDSGSQFTHDGALGGAFAVTKVLDGAMVYAGSSANTYSGSTTVNAGMLVLNKSVADGAIVAGSLIIGNDAGGPGSDIVRIAGSVDQIASAVAITVNSSGLLDLNGNSETIGAATALIMTFGTTFSGQVATGVGVLTVAGNIAINQATGSTLVSASPAASIVGNINLGGASRNITVADGLNVTDFEIAATIANGSIAKLGAGNLLLSANNAAAYSGTTTLSAGSLTVGDNNALGTGGLTLNAGTLRASGTRTIANSVSLAANSTIGGTDALTLGGVLTVGGNFTLTSSNAGGTTIGAVAFAATGNTWTVSNSYNALVTVSGIIDDGANTDSLAKTGTGTLVLANANTYDGTTTVTTGVIRVANAAALGSTTGGTTVAAGAALELQGGLTVAENLNVSGAGFNSVQTGAIRLLDADSSSSASTTLFGNIVLAAAASIGVVGGGASADVLNATGIVSGAFALTKVGLGIVELGGATTNTFGSLVINQGTVQLNKTLTNVAIAGAVTVGDGGGGDNADQLLYVAGAGSNQIANTSTITIAASGSVNMAAVSDSITGLVLNIGPDYSGDVDTAGATLTFVGAAATGITVSTAFTSSPTSGSAPAATVAGILDLGTAARTINVADTTIASAATDLVVSAAIGGVAAGTFTKSGAGTLVFTGTNSYAGATTVSAGTLSFGDNGSAVSSASFTVSAGATLVLDNSSTSNSNRIGNAIGITLSGGAFSFIGNATSATAETVGVLTLTASTASVIQSTAGASGQSMTFNGTVVRNAGATVHFIGSGADIDDINNRVLVGTGTALTNNILPYATIFGPSGFDFATRDGTGRIARLPAAMYKTSIASAGATDNVKLTASETGFGTKTINSLLLVGAVTAGGASDALTVQGTTSTISAIAATGGSSSIAAATLTTGSNESLYFVDASSAATVASNIAGTGAVRKERTGTLVFSGDNSNLSGAGATITVAAGVLNIRNGNALGATTAGTTVNAGAALEVQGGISVGNEGLTLNGTGVSGGGSLRNIAGFNVWGTGATAIAYATATAIAVDGAVDSLTLNATITNTGNLMKTGAGTLVYSGTVVNAGAGTTTVNAGTLALNKTGVNAIVAGLTIGDNIGGAGSDQVKLLAANQILDSVGPTINRSGKFDANGFSESLAVLTVVDGSVVTSAGSITATGLTMTGGAVNTGAGSLVLSGTLTYNAGAQSTVSGNLDLNAATRTISVADGSGLNDLWISALVSNGGISKSGNGALLITSASSTYAGGTTLTAGALAVGAATALGSGILALNAGTLRADGLNLTAANAIANAVTFGGAVTLGGRRDFGGTYGIELSGTGLGTSQLTANSTITVDDPLANITISASLGENAAGRTLGKSGIGSLTLSGANSFSGLFTLNAGILTARNALAFGTTAAGTTITAGAALQLDGGVAIGNEALTINGSGHLGDAFSGIGRGAVRSLSGSNAWGAGTTAITLGSASYVGVDAGQATLNGAIGGSFALTKLGAGALRYEGSTNNAYSGTTSVFAGTLALAKDANINAFAGGLTVGDFVNSASVSIINSEQIANAAAVTLASTGTINLLATAETVGAVTLNVGSTASSSIAIDTAATLSLNGNVTVSVVNGIGSSAPTTTITGGTLALLPSSAAAVATRTVTVADGSNDIDFTITSNIVDGAAFRASLTKAGAGRLWLNPATGSTYTGATTVSAGMLRIANSTALGAADGTANTATTVSAGAALEVDNSISVGNELLNISGNGITDLASTAYTNTIVGSGALRILGGDNSWSGGITLGAASAIGIASGASLNAAGVVAFATFNLVKAGGGSIELSGSSANTGSTGQLTVTEGTALLNKTGVVAAPVAVIVGNNRGADNSAVVRYGSAGGATVDQIAAVAVTVESTGSLDLATNNKSDTIGALTLSVGPTASADVATGTGVLAIGGAVTLIAETGTTTSSAAATISGSLDLGAAVRNFVISDTQAAIDLNVSAAITGTGGVTKTLNGTLAYSGSTANSYTGATTVSGGTLLLSKTAANAITGALTIGDSAAGADGIVVRYGASNQIADATTAIVTLNPSALLDLAGYSDTLTGATGAGTNVLGMQVGLFFSSHVATGTGTLTLGGGSGESGINVTAAAGTTGLSPAAVIEGNLDLGTQTRTLTIADTTTASAASDLVISATINGTSGAGLTKAGAGALLFSGTSANTFTGATTVNAGQLLLGKTANTVAIAGGLVVGDNAGGDDADQVQLLASNQTATTSAVSVASTGRFISGRNEIQTLTVPMGYTGTFTLTFGSSTTAALAANITAAALQTALTGLASIGTGNVAVAGVAATTGAPGFYTITFQGSLSATDVNALTVTADANGGPVPAITTLLNGGGSNDSIGSLSLTRGVAASGDVLSGSGTLTLGGDVTTANSGATTSASPVVTIAGNLDLGSAMRLFTVADSATAAANSDFTISAAIINGGLNKDGSGTLELTGITANTFTGGATVTAGVLNLNKSGGVTAIGGGAITIGDGTGGAGADILRLLAANQINDNAAVTVASSGRLDLNGFDDTVGSLAGASGSTVTMAAGSLIVGDATNTAFAGVISGSGGLTKQGAGVLALSGVNTYTGTTTINAGTLQLSGGAAIADANVVVLANAAGATLELNGSNETIGSLSGGGTTGGNLALTSGTLTTGNASSTIFAGAISGTGGLTKQGSGTFTITGANDYSGASTVNAGTLKLGGGSAIGDGSAVVLANVAGVALDLDGVSETIGSLAGGGATGGIVLLGSGTLTAGDAANTNFAGVISGSGGLTKQGAGALTLSNTNLYTGSTAIYAGAITLGVAGAIVNTSAVSLANVAGAAFNLNGFNQTIASLSGGGSTGGNITLGAGTLSVGDSTSTAYAGAISGTGGLTKQGSGTLLISGTNGYTGATTINAGVLQLAGGASLADVTSVSLANVNGAALDLNGSSETIGSLAGGGALGGNVILGAGTLTTGSVANTSYSGVVSGSGGLTKQGSGTLTLGGVNLYTGATTINAGSLLLGVAGAVANSASVTLANVSGALFDMNGFNQTIASLSGGGALGGNVAMGSGTLTVGNATNTNFAGVISGSGGLTKQGSGVLAISGANTYTGTTTINVGTLQLGGGAAIVDTNVVVLANTAGATLDLNGSDETIGSLAGGGSTGGSVALGSGTLTTGNGTNTVFAGVISGSGGLVKQGTGTFAVSGANLYAGTTAINGGVLKLVGGLAISDTSSVVLANVAGVALDLNNTNETIGSLSGGGSTGGNVSLGNGVLTTGDSSNTTFAGVVSGAGGLTKQGTGSLIISGANLYAGATTINGGVLKLVGGVALNDDSAVILANVAGAVLDLNNANETIGSLSGGGSLGGNVALGSGTLTAGDSTNTTFAGVISGTGGLTKEGSGSLVLSGANLYSGATTIQHGTVSLLGGVAIADSSAVVLTNNAGVMLNLNNTNETIASLAGGGSMGGNVALGSGALTTGDSSSSTFAGVISGTGSLTKQGSGSFSLTGANLYSGVTTVNAGLLALNGGAAIADDSAVVLANVGGVGLVLNQSEAIGGLSGGGDSGGNVSLGANTLTVNAVANATFAGVIGGAGGLIKAGGGTLTITSDQTYTGSTDVAAGVLLFNANADTSAVVVHSGATLGGTGVIQGTVDVNGGATLSPGVGLGTGKLSVGGAVTFHAGSTLEIAINGMIAGSDYDQLSANGVTIDPASLLTGTAGFAPPIGAEFLVIENLSAIPVVGMFANGSEIDLSGSIFAIDYVSAGVVLSLQSNPAPAPPIPNPAPVQFLAGVYHAIASLSTPTANSQPALNFVGIPFGNRLSTTAIDNRTGNDEAVRSAIDGTTDPSEERIERYWTDNYAKFQFVLNGIKAAILSGRAGADAILLEKHAPLLAEIIAAEIANGNNMEAIVAAVLEEIPGLDRATLEWIIDEATSPKPSTTEATRSIEFGPSTDASPIRPIDFDSVDAALIRFDGPEAIAGPHGDLIGFESELVDSCFESWENLVASEQHLVGVAASQRHQSGGDPNDASLRS